jgi:glycosyltransferase involved in cell wall biosynthesis
MSVLNIGVIFTYGISLKSWKKSGILNREIKIYRKLSEKSFKYTLITFGNDEDFYIKSKYKKLFKNIEVFPLYTKFYNFHNKYLNFLLSAFIPIFLRSDFKKFDIIKCNHLWGSWIGVANFLFNRVKFIIRCGYEINKNLEIEKNFFFKKFFLRFYSKFAYKFCHKIIVTTKEIKKYIIIKFSLEPQKIKIIPNYIDTDIFKKNFNKKIEKTFIFVGRFSKEKNIELITELLKNTDYKIHFVGIGQEQDKIRKLLNRYKIPFKFLGVIENEKLPQLLNKYKFFILTSKYEGHPKSLLESMACGCIPICAKSTGINEILINYKNGFFIPENKAQFKEFLMTIEKKKRLLENISINARKTVCDKFALNKILKKEYLFFLDYEKKK